MRDEYIGELTTRNESLEITLRDMEKKLIESKETIRLLKSDVDNYSESNHLLREALRELDSDYFAIAEKRIEDAVKKKTQEGWAVI